MVLTHCLQRTYTDKCDLYIFHMLTQLYTNLRHIGLYTKINNTFINRLSLYSPNSFKIIQTLSKIHATTHTHTNSFTPQTHTHTHTHTHGHTHSHTHTHTHTHTQINTQATHEATRTLMHNYVHFRVTSIVFVVKK